MAAQVAGCASLSILKLGKYPHISCPIFEPFLKDSSLQLLQWIFRLGGYATGKRRKKASEAIKKARRSR
jgi:hypothetical protein